MWVNEYKFNNHHIQFFLESLSYSYALLVVKDVAIFLYQLKQSLWN